MEPPEDLWIVEITYHKPKSRSDCARFYVMGIPATDAQDAITALREVGYCLSPEAFNLRAYLESEKPNVLNPIKTITTPPVLKRKVGI